MNCRIINFVLAGALAIVGYLYYDCKTGEVHYEGIPKQIISLEKAIQMKNEYQNVIAPLIENGRNTPNDSSYQATEFAFLELDSLKKYIRFLDEVKHLNDRDISGVRIYFAAYNGTNSTTYPGRETFFIAPTMKVASTEASAEFPIINHVPFYIKPNDAAQPLVGTYTEINGLKRSSNTPKNNTADTGTSLVLNELQICPPPAK